MKKITSEKAVLKKLNVNSVEDIPQKIEKFIDLLPSIDKELATQIINQFPEYRKICEEMIKSLDASCERALSSADKSLKRTVDSYTKILNRLEKKLSAKNISESEQEKITAEMVEIADKIANLHREHQNFLLKLLSIILFPITIVFGIIAMLLGFKKKSN